MPDAQIQHQVLVMSPNRDVGKGCIWNWDGCLGLDSPRDTPGRKGPGVQATGGRQGRWFKANIVRKDPGVSYQPMNRGSHLFPQFY